MNEKQTMVAPDRDRGTSAITNPVSGDEAQRLRFELRLPLGWQVGASAAVPVVWVAFGVLFGNVMASVLHDAQVRRLYSVDPSSSIPAQAFQDMLANLGVVLSAVGEGGRSMQIVLALLLFAPFFVPPSMYVGDAHGRVRSLRIIRRVLGLTAIPVAVLWSCAGALHTVGTGRPVNVAWSAVLGGALVAAIVVSVVMSYLDRGRVYMSWYCSGTGVSSEPHAAMCRVSPARPHNFPAGDR